MKPQDVNPGNFKVEQVLYNDGEFSVAFGFWKNETNGRLAMRWNGDEEADAGYPKVFGNPMWFQINDEISNLLLVSLLHLKSANHVEIAKIILK